jgi:hypothetical protein
MARGKATTRKSKRAQPRKLQVGGDPNNINSPVPPKNGKHTLIRKNIGDGWQEVSLSKNPSVKWWENPDTKNHRWNPPGNNDQSHSPVRFTDPRPSNLPDGWDQVHHRNNLTDPPTYWYQYDVDGENSRTSWTMPKKNTGNSAAAAAAAAPQPAVGEANNAAAAAAAAAAPQAAVGEANNAAAAAAPQAAVGEANNAAAAAAAPVVAAAAAPQAAADEANNVAAEANNNQNNLSFNSILKNLNTLKSNLNKISDTLGASIVGGSRRLRKTHRRRRNSRRGSRRGSRK